MRYQIDKERRCPNIRFRAESIFVKRKILSILPIISLLLSISNLFVAPRADAQGEIGSPRVGDCFEHSKAQVDSLTPQVMPIDCRELHNAEIYFVGKWPIETSPHEMSEKDAWEVGDYVCNSSAALRNFNYEKFNYWAWYVPTEKDWVAGKRWVRCDGMSTRSSYRWWMGISFWIWKKFQESQDYLKGKTFQSWTGSRL